MLCDKSFIGHTCSVKMAEYWLGSVLSVFKDRDKKITRATGVDAVGIRVTKVAAFPAPALDLVRQ